MIISKGQKVKIGSEKHCIRIQVNVGTLTLDISKKYGYTLVMEYDTSYPMPPVILAENFKRLGCINRYARCYGIEFEL